jgi:HSP20 family protein
MKWGLTKRGEDINTSLSALGRDINKVFDEFFSIKHSTMFDYEWSPIIDVEEDEKMVHVKAEIAGIDEKDLNVTVANNTLTIKGEKNEERKEDDKRYVISERKFGSFCRSISLPDGINVDNIKAAYKNGVLNIEIPRDKSTKPNRIKIDVK